MTLNPQAAYVIGMHGDPWEIEPSRMKAMLETVIVTNLTAEEIEERTGPRPAKTKRAIAVLPLQGPITKRASAFTAFFGGTSTDKFGEAFDSLMANDAIGAIVLDVDSPGGTVEGTMELTEKMYAARGTKPVVAVANGFMASAAYKIASAADQIVVIPSGQAGSIGTRAMHLDYSAALEKDGVKPTVVYAGEHKTEFDPFAPLSEEAKAEMQRVVDEYYGEFVKSVARNRNTTVARVKKEFGGGRMMLAKQAVEAGLADRVGTLEETIARLGGKLADRAAARAAADARRLELDKLEAELPEKMT